MTVAELIEQLSALPQDAVVEMYSYDDYSDEPVVWLPLREVRATGGDAISPAVVRVSY